MSYTEFVLAFLERSEPCMPIYTHLIADALAKEFEIDRKKAAQATAIAMKRIMDRGKLSDLRFFQKGIYYRTLITPLGEAVIRKSKLIADKYLLPDIGYETGYRLINRLGLTTQVASRQVIATNVAKSCMRYDRKLDVYICRPKTMVNAENKKYLQLLDALDLLDKAPVDEPDTYRVIAELIEQNNMQYERLLDYADKYYNKRTIVHLAHTASKMEFKI